MMRTRETVLAGVIAFISSVGVDHRAGRLVAAGQNAVQNKTVAQAPPTEESERVQKRLLPLLKETQTLVSLHRLQPSLAPEAIKEAVGALVDHGDVAQWGSEPEGPWFMEESALEDAESIVLAAVSSDVQTLAQIQKTVGKKMKADTVRILLLELVESGAVNAVEDPSGYALPPRRSGVGG
jgi:hypothetical protein